MKNPFRKITPQEVAERRAVDAVESMLDARAKATEMRDLADWARARAACYDLMAEMYASRGVAAGARA